MQKKLPPFKNEDRVLIICEGYEEYDYLQKLKTCAVWNKDISVELKNAKSIDNIYSIYSYHYSSGNYKLIVVFCDTEKHPYKQCLALKKKINKFHGKKASEHVVFFSNPCTLQIVLSHFKEVQLTTNSKSENASIVKELTGVENYNATDQQRAAIMKKITAKNYTVMEQNISKLSDDYSVVPSSNASRLFRILDNGDKTRIKEINKKIG